MADRHNYGLTLWTGRTDSTLALGVFYGKVLSQGGAPGDTQYTHHLEPEKMKQAGRAGARSISHFIQELKDAGG